MLRRAYVDADTAFQGDLAEDGRLDKALRWELDYSRIAVQVRDNGGLVSAAPMFGHRWVHIRIWYPAFEDVVAEMAVDDIRISVTAHYGMVGDVIETLEGYFAGATIVSSGIANSDPDGYKSWGDMAKPKRSEDVDRHKLEAMIPARSTPHRGWGDNAWVA